jgi:hypothetical protein
VYPFVKLLREDENYAFAEFSRIVEEKGDVEEINSESDFYQLVCFSTAGKKWSTEGMEKPKDNC